MRTAAAYPGVALVNLHALGGEKMLRRAVQAFHEGAAGRSDLKPKLLAVTILTSMDTADLRPLGISGPAGRRALELARLAKRHGLDGVVASGRDVAAIRRAFGAGFIILVPGVRPGVALGRAPDDQRRTVTAGEAVRAGADYVVVGRPITAATDPRAAADAIVAEIAAALQRRD